MMRGKPSILLGGGSVEWCTWGEPKKYTYGTHHFSEFDMDFGINKFVFFLTVEDYAIVVNEIHNRSIPSRALVGIERTDQEAGEDEAMVNKKDEVSLAIVCEGQFTLRMFIM